MKHNFIVMNFSIVVSSSLMEFVFEEIDYVAYFNASPTFLKFII